MTAKILLHKLHFWAALSLIALTVTPCSEPASPYGQAEIAFTSNIAQKWGKYHEPHLLFVYSPNIIQQQN
ncbi:MAG: hypothetical protein AMXMBFR48_28340 [Ignavibacteriales bacterium]